MLTQSLLKVMDNTTSLSVHRKSKCRRDKHGASYKTLLFQQLRGFENSNMKLDQQSLYPGRCYEPYSPSEYQAVSQEICACSGYHLVNCC
jgi:hypothetical protein